MTKKIKAVRYTGGGDAFVGGVPMRDLEIDEWARLSDLDREVCIATGLYTIEYDEPPAKVEPTTAKAAKE